MRLPTNLTPSEIYDGSRNFKVKMWVKSLKYWMKLYNLNEDARKFVLLQSFSGAAKDWMISLQFSEDNKLSLFESLSSDEILESLIEYFYPLEARELAATEIETLFPSSNDTIDSFWLKFNRIFSMVYPDCGPSRNIWNFFIN